MPQLWRRGGSMVRMTVSDVSTAAPAVETTRAALPDDRFLDRELSWLAFNKRVLELAEDPDVPLLERAKFLAIA